MDDPPGHHPTVSVKLAALHLRMGEAAEALSLLEETVRQRPNQCTGSSARPSTPSAATRRRAGRWPARSS